MLELPIEIALEPPLYILLELSHQLIACCEQDLEAGLFQNDIYLGNPRMRWWLAVIYVAATLRHCTSRILECTESVEIFEANEHTARALSMEKGDKHHVNQQIRNITHGQIMTVTGMCNRYHTISIRSEDRHKTTFLMEEGRHRSDTAWLP